MNRITILFVFFIFNIISAQNKNEYIPEEIDSINTYFKLINTNRLKSIKGPFSSKVKEIYKGNDEKNIKKVKDSVFLFNATIKNHLSFILDNIYTSNPEINSKNFGFFIKNDPIANASCYGDGMFEINLGLFNALESDDELAFVICHEMAHHILHHSLKTITKSVRALNSKEAKKKIRGIKRKRIGKTRAALQVIDELNIDVFNYSKEVEAEADSLGYLLYRKTIYNKSKATTALEKLKKVDDMVLHHNIKLDSIFSFENYPFKDFWMKESASIFDADLEINEFSLVSDTLETHPEIGFRIKKLKKDFSIDSKSDKTFDINLNIIKRVSHIKSINYTIDKKALDLAIYLLVEKIENNLIKEEEYYSSMAKVIQLIYIAKKNHRLGLYVQPKNSFSKEKQLNKIRLFINNLELREVRKIGLAFCEAHINKSNGNKEFNNVFKFFKNK